MYFEANSLLLGTWYGSNDAMTFLIGLKGKPFQVGYSYDLYPTSMMGSNLGSHEISYVQSIKINDEKRVRYRTTPCPKF
ncbi:MAG: type IX secretion system membrane protein PorP/SprF [Flavobacteriales bacterium]|nr:type IX secretion system membrane protein PorP/SprF [Flavobacteriales bacterium]